MKNINGTKTKTMMNNPSTLERIEINCLMETGIYFFYQNEELLYISSSYSVIDMVIVKHHKDISHYSFVKVDLSADQLETLTGEYTNEFKPKYSIRNQKKRKNVKHSIRKWHKNLVLNQDTACNNQKVLSLFENGYGNQTAIEFINSERVKEYFGFVDEHIYKKLLEVVGNDNIRLDRLLDEKRKQYELFKIQFLEKPPAKRWINKNGEWVKNRN